MRSYFGSWLFESCVVSDGNQTGADNRVILTVFESCVVSDGNQTVNSMDYLTDSV